MANSRIGVGLIGVTPGRSWGAIAHIPALRALPDFEVAAVANSNADSAAAAAKALNLPAAYGSALELAADPKVDLVAVTVKVPQHFALVKAAVAAGKDVFCEWPLGNGLDEAVELDALARRAGVRTIIGLQARVAPVIHYVRDLLRDGFVGDVLSTTLVGSGMSWGAVMEKPNAYTGDKKSGASVLTIPFGHTVDAVCMCLGEFRTVNADLAVRRKSFTIAGTNETLPMTAEDQVAVTGTLESGAVAAIHYRGGASRGTNLLWEINGTKGDLMVTAPAGHAQLTELSLFGGSGADRALKPMPLPKGYDNAPAAAQNVARNVALLYQLYAKDRKDGTSLCPGFDVAVKRHRMIVAVEEAARSGHRIEVKV